MNDKIDLEKYKIILETGFDAAAAGIMGTQVTQLLATLMEVKGATIFVVNPKTEELEILSTQGLSLNYVNKGPILVDKSIRLASNREPMIIEETKQSKVLQYPEKAEAEGIRSIVSFPVNLGGKIIGALRIYHSEPWHVSEQEKIYLSLLARSIGMALKIFRLSSAVQCTRELFNEIHPVWL